MTTDVTLGLMHAPTEANARRIFVVFRVAVYTLSYRPATYSLALANSMEIDLEQM